MSASFKPARKKVKRRVRRQPRNIGPEMIPQIIAQYKAASHAAVRLSTIFSRIASQEVLPGSNLEVAGLDSFCWLDLMIEEVELTDELRKSDHWAFMVREAGREKFEERPTSRIRKPRKKRRR